MNTPEQPPQERQRSSTVRLARLSMTTASAAKKKIRNANSVKIHEAGLGSCFVLLRKLSDEAIEAATNRRKRHANGNGNAHQPLHRIVFVE